MGAVKGLVTAWGNTCAICKRQLDPEKLNYEAKIHHSALELECINRKECQRAKRKTSNGNIKTGR